MAAARRKRGAKPPYELPIGTQIALGIAAAALGYSMVTAIQGGVALARAGKQVPAFILAVVTITGGVLALYGRWVLSYTFGQVPRDDDFRPPGT